MMLKLKFVIIYKNAVTVMFGGIELPYSANCPGDLITTFLLKTCLKTAFVTVPAIPSTIALP